MHVLCFSPLLTTTMCVTFMNIHYHHCIGWLKEIYDIWFSYDIFIADWLQFYTSASIFYIGDWLIGLTFGQLTLYPIPSQIKPSFYLWPQNSLIWDDSFCPTQTCSALFIFFFYQIFVNQGVTSGKTKTWLGVSLIKHFTLLSKRTTSNWWNFFTHSKIYCWDIFNFCIWRLLYHSWTQRILSIMQ